MAPTATLLLERIEAPVLRPVETAARLAYPLCYVGDANPHLTGQPCDVLARASTSTGADSYVVVFACGCREVVPGWTLKPNTVPR
ncbi:MAG TPA: hypothetical protein VKV73_12440 [Chloroflexota bacterium]|nr:hypothetical protein [Chloroflexota bacterium]